MQIRGRNQLTPPMRKGLASSDHGRARWKADLPRPDTHAGGPRAAGQLSSRARTRASVSQDYGTRGAQEPRKRRHCVVGRWAGALHGHLADLGYSRMVAKHHGMRRARGVTGIGRGNLQQGHTLAMSIVLRPPVRQTGLWIRNPARPSAPILPGRVHKFTQLSMKMCRVVPLQFSDFGNRPRTPIFHSLSVDRG